MNMRPTSPHDKSPRPPLLAPAACALLMLSGPLAAQTSEPPPGETVIITGSIQQRRIDEAPYAITAVTRDELRAAGPMINLSEALSRVPGLVVNNRSNFAQDLQIASRGFGARATFGVRGVRLYADGIPASGPDGQGQVSHMDIGGAQRVEVLRGPYSSLYGNSSGGVIAIFTEPVRRAEWEAGLDLGSFGLRQGRGSLALALGQGFDLRASASEARIEGFRPQSEADKRQAQLRLGFVGERDRLTLLVNGLDQPALDPLGLTQAQFAQGPEQVASVAQQFNTRKTQRQAQTGVNWTHRFDQGALRESSLSAYLGERAITQWLAIAPATQANVRHGGGVVDFDRRFDGVEGRLRWAFEGLDLTAGFAWDRQRDDRRGYENFTGTGPSQLLGVTGRLRRDEVNDAQTRDLFAQAEWSVSPRLVASAGLRAGKVDMSSQDAYLSNGNDSGAVSFDYSNPVLGLRWQAAPGLQLHASAARGFESPTLGELAYRADGSGGFNTALKPQRSHQAEVGLRARLGGWRGDLTAFAVRTRDEIGVATNAGGRSAFQNVGRTSREGLELALNGPLAAAWRVQLAANVLRAVYRDGFLACAGIPCNAPTVPVPAGNRIAGAPKAGAFAELAWRGGAWGTWGLELKGSSGYYANDRNTAVAAVAGYGTASLRWSKSYALGGSGLRAEWLLRVDNLSDRRYAGSVIVNDANDRYFEPGAPRSVLLALRLSGGL
jgi:iron complex outermembrane recepter protein